MKGIPTTLRSFTIIHYWWLLAFLFLFGGDTTVEARDGYYGQHSSVPDHTELQDGCFPLHNHTGNETDTTSCMRQMKTPDTGAAIAVGIIAMMWICGGVYAARNHRVVTYNSGDRACSESGDTVADSTWDTESVKEDAAEVTSNHANTNNQEPEKSSLPAQDV